MIVFRRESFVAAVVFSAVFAGAMVTKAAEFPDRPVRFVVGLAAGGGADASTRLIAKKLSEKWGKPVVVENRPGADGSIAAERVSRASPDGYTIYRVWPAHVIPPVGYSLNYDPIKSFAPVTLIGYSQNFFLVNSSLSVNSLKELIALAKTKPGQLNFGSSGAGSPQYLDMQNIRKQTGIDIVNVSYSGNGPALVALLGNEVQLLLTSIGNSLEQVKTGKIKALAVTGSTRSPAAPTVPTMAEAANLSGFEIPNWAGVSAPAGTPKEIITKLHHDIVSVVNLPDVRQIFDSDGVIIATELTKTPEEFGKFLTNEVVRYRSLVGR